MLDKEKIDNGYMKSKFILSTYKNVLTEYLSLVTAFKTVPSAIRAVIFRCYCWLRVIQVINATENVIFITYDSSNNVSEMHSPPFNAA